MRFLKHVLAALTISLLAAGAQAAPDNPQNGVDYRTLEKPQQTDSGKKVEVTEFFWYSCPHCSALETDLAAWVKKQGDNIVFKRVPVAFRESMVPQQKLYYTLEAMGKLDELHAKVFQTIHADRDPINKEQSIVEWAGKQGLDKAKFQELYNSFSVSSKARRATQLQDAFKVQGVPALGIAGRYYTDGTLAGDMNRALQVTDYLIAEARKSR